ncbi:MAG: hypothetical protein O7C75_18515 [Verrucomicrobia bacterium]|nr:hypothetical protein [Verrucomicrobiota bacterium]
MTPLHHIGDFFRQLVLAVPLPLARAIFVLVLVVLLIWIIRLPSERVRPPSNDQGGWASNLKLWAAIAIVLQILIYLII